MARNLIYRYIWVIDTIERYGALTLERLNELWVASPVGDRNPLPRRTFYNYRQAIADTFGITIEINPRTFEYYIDRDSSESDAKRQQWMLDSMSVSGMLSDAGDVRDRVVLENVPSARGHLPVVLDAMKQNRRICFSYKPYTRLTVTRNVVVEPYFVKIFRQLWYVVGYNVRDNKVKTYSLDRMSDLLIASTTFELPRDFDAETFFADCYGIVTNQGEAKRIVLRANSTQAKYFRSLPLHPSQQEEVHDSYSIFTYRMRNTYDLRERLLSHGSNVEVLAPPELRAQIVEELRNSLKNYEPTRKN